MTTIHSYWCFYTLIGPCAVPVAVELVGFTATGSRSRRGHAGVLFKLSPTKLDALSLPQHALAAAARICPSAVDLPVLAATTEYFVPVGRFVTDLLVYLALVTVYIWPCLNEVIFSCLTNNCYLCTSSSTNTALPHHPPRRHPDADGCIEMIFMFLLYFEARFARGGGYIFFIASGVVCE